MRQLIVAVVLGLTLADAYAACDQVGARKSQRMLREMAVWSEKGGVITFKWGPDWDHATPDERDRLLHAFADSEACLTGHAKEINYYRLGKLVGTASPTSGIRLIK